MNLSKHNEPNYRRGRKGRKVRRGKKGKGEGKAWKEKGRREEDNRNLVILYFPYFQGYLGCQVPLITLNAQKRHPRLRKTHRSQKSGRKK